MKTDSYTKVILTIIATCLSIMIFKDFEIVPSAQATPTDTTSSELPINYGLVPLNADGSITVRLATSEQLDVNIKNIDTYDKLRVDLYSVSTSDELDVNIDEIGGAWISNGGPLKVSIQQ